MSCGVLGILSTRSRFPKSGSRGSVTSTQVSSGWWRWVLRSDVVRRHRPQMADEVCRAPYRRSTDTASDPKMAQSRSVRRWEVVENNGRYTSGFGDFTVPCKRISALCSRPLGGKLAEANRDRHSDLCTVRGRFRHGIPKPIRRRTLSPRTSGATRKVRVGTAPGQDSFDRVRTLCG